MKRSDAYVRFLTLTDGLFGNNPVLAKGILLAPIIGCASLKSAAALSVAALVTSIPAILVAALLKNRIAGWLRAVIYTLVSAVFYLPALYLITLLLGSAVRSELGIYLPLMILNSLISYRSENAPFGGRIGPVLRDSVMNILGFAAVAFIVGALREFFGTGMLWGAAVQTSLQPAVALILPFGGLFVLGFLGAFYRFLSARLTSMTKLINVKREE